MRLQLLWARIGDQSRLLAIPSQVKILMEIINLYLIMKLSKEPMVNCYSKVTWKSLYRLAAREESRTAIISTEII